MRFALSVAHVHTGRQVRSFRVAARGAAEVAHACVYHSGLFALTYPQQAAAAPRVMHAQWAQSLLDAAPAPAAAMNGGAALAATGGNDAPTFRCMAAQTGGPAKVGGGGGSSVQIC